MVYAEHIIFYLVEKVDYLEIVGKELPIFLTKAHNLNFDYNHHK
jgi:hypothetical protein